MFEFAKFYICVRRCFSKWLFGFAKQDKNSMCRVSPGPISTDHETNTKKQFVKTAEKKNELQKTSARKKKL